MGKILTIFQFTMMKLTCLLIIAAFVAQSQATTLRCIDGYYKVSTIKTYDWANWGPWDCLSAGIPCANTDGASAFKQLKAQWEANGGKSWKSWRTNRWCENEKSGSAPWNIADATWRFSLLHRRQNRRRLGGALKCIGGYYRMSTRKTYEWKNWGKWNCLNVGIACTETDGATAKKNMEREWVENGGKSWKAWRENEWCDGNKAKSRSDNWVGQHDYSKNQTWNFMDMP